MLDNHLYNLCEQFVQENKSLWRIETMYLKDAEGHDQDVSFWEKMKADKKEHITELKGLIKTHLGD